MTTDLIILGARGSSTSIIEAVWRINEVGPARYNLVGMLDDLPENQGTSTLGVPVLGPIGKAADYPNSQFINAIFSIASFRKVPEVIARTGLTLDRFETIIDPTAVVSRTAIIGRGTCIMACAYVAARVTIGNHVLVSPHVALNHDCTVGNYIGIASGVHVNGFARIGDCALLGSGALIAPHVDVGESAVVGMGSVVTSHVARGQVVAGNPARHVPSSAYNLS